MHLFGFLLHGAPNWLLLKHLNTLIAIFNIVICERLIVRHSFIIILSVHTIKPSLIIPCGLNGHPALYRNYRLISKLNHLLWHILLSRGIHSGISVNCKTTRRTIISVIDRIWLFHFFIDEWWNFNPLFNQIVFIDILQQLK